MAVVATWKLQALKYPRAEQFDIKSKDEVVNMVSFLEDRHIRYLDISERAPLRKHGAGWDAAFQSYLQDLGCPLLPSADADNSDNISASYSADKLPQYLQWLVAKAFSLDYEEKAAEYNAGASAMMVGASRAAGSGAGAGSSSMDVDAPTQAAPIPQEALGLINQLATLCHVETAGRSPLQILQRVHRVVRQRVLPAAASLDGAGDKAGAGAGASSSSSASASGASRAGSLPSREPTRDEILTGLGFPLGISTGQPTLDAAARILRMLYVADLRELQDAVTDLLVAVQEYTADPRTDASLGAVGR